MASNVMNSKSLAIIETSLENLTLKSRSMNEELIKAEHQIELLGCVRNRIETHRTSKDEEPIALMLFGLLLDLMNTPEHCSRKNRKVIAKLALGCTNSHKTTPSADTNMWSQMLETLDLIVLPLDVADEIYGELQDLRNKKSEQLKELVKLLLETFQILFGQTGPIVAAVAAVKHDCAQKVAAMQQKCDRRVVDIREEHQRQKAELETRLRRMQNSSIASMVEWQRKNHEMKAAEKKRANPSPAMIEAPIDDGGGEVIQNAQEHVIENIIKQTVDKELQLVKFDLNASCESRHHKQTQEYEEHRNENHKRMTNQEQATKKKIMNTYLKDFAEHEKSMRERSQDMQACYDKARDTLEHCEQELNDTLSGSKFTTYFETVDKEMGKLKKEMTTHKTTVKAKFTEIDTDMRETCEEIEDVSEQICSNLANLIAQRETMTRIKIRSIIHAAQEESAVVRSHLSKHELALQLTGSLRHGDALIADNLIPGLNYTDFAIHHGNKLPLVTNISCDTKKGFGQDDFSVESLCSEAQDPTVTHSKRSVRFN